MAEKAKIVRTGKKRGKLVSRSGKSVLARSKTAQSIKSTQIKKIGNGAFVPVSRDELKAMGTEIGAEVSVTVEDGRMTVAKADGAYERTRRSAEKMGARYALTLKLFGQ
ncbi:hypothetical protein LNKW23_24530 [Paralimibaculum aggregatum]|uniref:Uncharacterized protein n=1 Tax=Paralimibaculum aggregatum TaxID=3036245 RepID=A0ABQ6LLR9_9RHOB|nr:hypothetical protein [Limibaculum sp. NKW23]GMG83240.1 hypothetical protein LNKW23_24530 [Limibaculum sp. NKW23]